MKDTEQYIIKCSGLGRLVESIKPKNDIEQYLFQLSCLGSIVSCNNVFTVCGQSAQYLRTNRCKISAMCVLPVGEILVLDVGNNQVMLLDQQCQVVSHCSVAADSREMCQITPSEVALTVDYGNTHAVQFITVTMRHLVTGRKIELQHKCSGIAHHQGDLFITSNTALYRYSLSGKQISKLHEDKYGSWTGKSCWIHPDVIKNLNKIKNGIFCFKLLFEH
ncbi:hypothetical protein DPMN_152435 [Dreissena polymorpha]|uniref:Uncharacterized protein n=1 Tax=Dreissena polymorpha TaxID=45954 RepID=A0A9D4J8C3_DREPO|nr:hypothetical protein DPMN_152435 [Dreissena polymorpha]